VLEGCAFLLSVLPPSLMLTFTSHPTHSHHLVVSFLSISQPCASDFVYRRQNIETRRSRHAAFSRRPYSVQQCYPNLSPPIVHLLVGTRAIFPTLGYVTYIAGKPIVLDLAGHSTIRYLRSIHVCIMQSGSGQPRITQIQTVPKSDDSLSSLFVS
jgi:hypothetical protein